MCMFLMYFACTQKAGLPLLATILIQVELNLNFSCLLYMVSGITSLS